MKIIKKDLILKDDTTFNEDLKVEGNIKGYFDLKVKGFIDCDNIDCGNINCKNIDCWDIDCGNINCRNINCRNINCRNINCWNINCWNIIFCNKIKCNKEIKARKLIKNRDKLKQKVWK
ncbi:MAG: hypothetical protein ACTSW3_07220 [Promethearchaeota archaeon]